MVNILLVDELLLKYKVLNSFFFPQDYPALSFNHFSFQFPFHGEEKHHHLMVIDAATTVSM